MFKAKANLNFLSFNPWKNMFKTWKHLSHGRIMKKKKKLYLCHHREICALEDVISHFKRKNLSQTGSQSRMALTVSSENQSRFSCKEFTHQAWVNARSPASNIPAAMETKGFHGHEGRISELGQVLDLLRVDVSMVSNSDVRWGLSTKHIKFLLELSSVPAVSDRRAAGDSSHNLALLRRTITRT